MHTFIASITTSHAELDKEESWHCAKVLRCRPGEEIRLIDGKGNFYEAVLESVNDKRCAAIVSGGPFPQAKRNYYLHLAIAPTKQMDRMEWLLEKAVEIGIDEISFIECRSSERRTIKTDRLQKIAGSAVKQSLQALLPRINGMEKFESFIQHVSADKKLIAHCGQGDMLPLQKVEFINSRIISLIGPEGDFTESETEMAMKHGFTGVSLGNNRLRTETAGLYIVQAAALLSLEK